MNAPLTEQETTMVTRLAVHSQKAEADMMMGHTVLIMNSRSTCCNCKADALPHEGRCRACGTTWRFMMSNMNVSDTQLELVTDDLRRCYPHLTFAGLGEHEELSTPYFPEHQPR